MAAAAARPTPSHDNWKTIPCKFFLRGKCRKDTSCTYIHQGEKIDYKTKTSYNPLTAVRALAPSSEAVKTAPRIIYRKAHPESTQKTCNFFSKGEPCPYEASPLGCRYKHFLSGANVLAGIKSGGPTYQIPMAYFARLHAQQVAFARLRTASHIVNESAAQPQQAAGAGFGNTAAAAGNAAANAVTPYPQHVPAPLHPPIAYPTVGPYSQQGAAYAPAGSYPQYAPGPPFAQAPNQGNGSSQLTVPVQPPRVYPTDRAYSQQGTAYTPERSYPQYAPVPPFAQAPYQGNGSSQLTAPVQPPRVYPTDRAYSQQGTAYAPAGSYPQYAPGPPFAQAPYQGNGSSQLTAPVQPPRVYPTNEPYSQQGTAQAFHQRNGLLVAPAQPPVASTGAHSQHVTIHSGNAPHAVNGHPRLMTASTPPHPKENGQAVRTANAGIAALQLERAPAGPSAFKPVNGKVAVNGKLVFNLRVEVGPSPSPIEGNKEVRKSHVDTFLNADFSDPRELPLPPSTTS